MRFPPLGGPLRIAAWHTLWLAVILIGPVQRRAGWPAWRLPETAMLQAGWGGLAYLIAALIFTLATARQAENSKASGIMHAALALGLAFVPPLVLLTILPDLAFSRGLFLVSGVLASVSLGALALVSTAPRLMIVLPLAGLVAVIAEGRSLGTTVARPVDTQLYSLHVEARRPAPLDADTLVEGGGLARLGDGLVLVTGAGRFAHLVRDPSDTAWQVRPLNIPSPANSAAFAAGAPAGTAVSLFRVIDLLAEPRGDSVVITVTHHHWDADAKCYTVRVSETVGSIAQNQWGEWRRRFDARPCLPIRDLSRGLPFNGAAAGGRMVRLEGQGLLITFGDHQYDGLNAPDVLPQDTASDYGHTVLLREDNSARSFTMGHRNPQGLARDASGRIWSTEHGPRGGDEVNLLRDGDNYGWPWRTHGVEYSLRRWPGLRPPSDAWREPIFSFVPSRGISNLLSVQSTRFPAWRGDLLVGTLKARELLRLHLDGERVAFIEQIPIGQELRDIEEAADGSLVVWTDQGLLLTIRPDSGDDSGAALAAQCAGCHTLGQGQQGALGPNLYGIVGRSVASTGGYDYSPALRALGGRWTPERLDQYLANPADFAPGNRMMFAGIPDSAARRTLIEYLRTSAGR